MAKQPKPCTAPGCPYLKKIGHPKFCVWHWLSKQPPDIQTREARKRWKKAMDGLMAIERKQVPKEEWPEGERWCAGCQSFVPFFYVRGSRCVACASTSAHLSHIKATYGLSAEEYQALYDWQGGRCYICRRVSKSKRLAVDHDHVTGEVRGLLCPDETRGCNHAVLGNIKDIDMARRIVEYLERPPMVRVRAGEPGLAQRQVVEAGEKRLYPNGRHPRNWLETVEGFTARKEAGLTGDDLVLPYGTMPRREPDPDPEPEISFDRDNAREILRQAAERPTSPHEPAPDPSGYIPAPFIDSPF